MADSISASVLGAFGRGVDLAAVARGLQTLKRRHLAKPEHIAAFAAASEAERADPALFMSVNVVGVGLGEKITSGERTGKLAFKILVREKVLRDAIKKRHLIESPVAKVPVDVEAVGEIRAYFQNRHRPIIPGTSIGNCQANMAGTFGCVVGDADRAAILSNNHVLALVNSSPPNQPIPQPGRLDGGVCPADEVADLTRFVPIDFNPGATNTVDCAIARIRDAIAVDRRIFRGPGKAPEALHLPTVTATLGANVQKSGRTTGFTQGAVDLVKASIAVNYGSPANPRMASFVDVFRVSRPGGLFSQAGDSGSLITTRPRNQPMGLLFAGGGQYTFCCDIDPVLAALNVSILT